MEKDKYYVYACMMVSSPFEFYIVGKTNNDGSKFMCTELTYDTKEEAQIECLLLNA